MATTAGTGGSSPQGSGGSENGPNPTGGGGDFNLSDFLGNINLTNKGSGQITPGDFGSNFNPYFNAYNVGQATGFANPGQDMNGGGQGGGGPFLRGGAQAMPMAFAGGGQGPSGGAFNGLQFRGSGSNFQGLADAANGGTITNFNRAANRLRERLDAQAQSQTKSNINSLGARGIGNSGAANVARNSVQQNARNQFAQGLVGLEQGFEGFRQQGLQTALGALQGRSQEALQGNQLNQGLFKFIEEQSQGNQEFLQELLTSANQGATQQELEALLAKAGLMTEESIAQATGSANGISGLLGFLGPLLQGSGPKTNLR